jgi:hypothetical protein
MRVLFVFLVGGLGMVVTGCGARSGLDGDRPPPDGGAPDGGRVDAGRFDGGRFDGGRFDGGPFDDGGVDGGEIDGGAVDAGPDECVPVDPGCSGIERCEDGEDNDCDGAVDEGCACDPGQVQPCFAGPPGNRNVGACQDGSQVCGADGAWGACEGGILPDPDVCTGRDDLCNGCSDARICPVDCPSPGDPRVPVGRPFTDYRLNGRDFYSGPATAWRWRIEGGPCDALSPGLDSFDLRSPRSDTATFFPRLSGDYRVTLAVTVPTGEILECSWLIHVEGPGLRIEMCYPESETQDLDLFLHRPDDTARWYATGGTASDPNAPASCGWHNCEATIRGTTPIGTPLPRADWGYADTPLERCVNGPLGEQWRRRGSCANPRLDIDNNLSEGTGVPENINVDNPRDGQTFRVMVQNWSGTRARPVVNVYCGGRRIATYGQAPDIVPRFTGRSGAESVGAMWRVADVTVRVDDSGNTTGCDVAALHPPGSTTGYDVTNDDGRY